jgi:hypothetical protein
MRALAAADVECLLEIRERLSELREVYLPAANASRWLRGDVLRWTVAYWAAQRDKYSSEVLWQ